MPSQRLPLSLGGEWTWILYLDGELSWLLAELGSMPRWAEPVPQPRVGCAMPQQAGGALWRLPCVWVATRRLCVWHNGHLCFPTNDNWLFVGLFLCASCRINQKIKLADGRKVLHSLWSTSHLLWGWRSLSCRWLIYSWRQPPFYLEVPIYLLESGGIN
jgi:hypothetical protein